MGNRNHQPGAASGLRSRLILQPFPQRNRALDQLALLEQWISHGTSSATGPALESLARIPPFPRRAQHAPRIELPLPACLHMDAVLSREGAERIMSNSPFAAIPKKPN